MGFNCVHFFLQSGFIMGLLANLNMYQYNFLYKHINWQIETNDFLLLSVEDTWLIIIKKTDDFQVFNVPGSMGFVF